jgi:hypothetical protein
MLSKFEKIRSAALGSVRGTFWPLLNPIRTAPPFVDYGGFHVKILPPKSINGF